MVIGVQVPGVKHKGSVYPSFSIFLRKEGQTEP